MNLGLLEKPPHHGDKPFYSILVKRKKDKRQHQGVIVAICTESIENIH
jgi:hypothetical protein